MRNFDFSGDSSSSSSLLGTFQNRNFHDGNGNNNINGYGNGDTTARIPPPSPVYPKPNPVSQPLIPSSLPVTPSPNLVSQPRVFTSPMTPLRRTLLPNPEPLPTGLPKGHQLSLPVHEYNGHDMTFYMLASLGFFGMMTRREGHAEFPKLLNRLNENSLRLIADKLASDARLFVRLATNPLGSTAVRTLLRRSNYLDDLLLFAVHENFMGLMTSKYGQYVVIPTLRAVNKQKRSILYAIAESHALQLACHEIGCASLNDFLKEVRGEYKDRILSLIAANALWLSQDHYGNFVVQYVLSLQNPFLTDRIGRLLHGNYVHLSSQRLGSYVVEKCLRSMWAMEYVMDELIKSDSLLRLAKNEFGNYVVQSALKVMRAQSQELYEKLANKLRPHFHDLQRGFGKNTLRVIQILDQQQDDDHLLQ